MKITTIARAFGIAGWVVAFGAGALLWLWYASAIGDWLGPLIGWFVAISTAPGLVVFPIVFRLVEGEWVPSLYFILMATGVAGTVLGGICIHVSSDDDRKTET